MTEGQDERTARLFAGRGESGSGLPLPDAFAAVLTALHDAAGRGEALAEDELNSIIKAKMIHKDTRVLSIWKNWEEFCLDILCALEDRDYLARDREGVTLGSRAVPGTILSALRQDNRQVRFVFHAREGRAIREALANARESTEKVIAYLTSVQDLHPTLARARDKLTGVSEILTQGFSQQKKAAPVAAPPAPPAERVYSKKERGKPEPPDQPEEMRKCIGTCLRTLPLTREHFECYWSERKLVSGRMSGDWYWRRDCRECHSVAKHAGSSRSGVIRAQRKEELRLWIAEVGEPYPSIYQVTQNLNIDAANVRKLWRELYAEGKAPPLPPPPPTYPRPPKIGRER